MEPLWSDMSLTFPGLPRPRGRGHAAPPLEVGAPRELSAGEAALLSAHRGITASPVKALRESHHQLARLLASGLRPIDAGRITGYSQSRISILKQDPAFQELLEHYSGCQAEAFADVQTQLAAMSLDALGELRDRLQGEPEAFSNRELLLLTQALLDRAGHGPSSKVQSTSVSLALTTEDLARVKQLAMEGMNGRISQPQVAGAGPAAGPSVSEVPQPTRAPQRLPLPAGARDSAE